MIGLPCVDKHVSMCKLVAIFCKAVSFDNTQDTCSFSVYQQPGMSTYLNTKTVTGDYFFGLFCDLVSQFSGRAQDYNRNSSPRRSLLSFELQPLNCVRHFV